jgi:hypothetical protein
MVVTRSVAENFLRLKHGPENLPLRNWLTETLQEVGRKCEDLEGVQLHRAQGKAKAYRELLELIENASALVEKTKQQK